ncbi:MAG: HNH endonuclease [Candidatus Gastranaerophilales bacterium]|nr:HNH endonuclease [Candidatus Gastranaerophilales bacterium]
MEKVLLLNASYEPLRVCSWRRALVLVLKGKADEISCLDSFIDGQDSDVPYIIKMRYYVAVPYQELPFSKQNILVRDNYTCQYCGKTHCRLTLDHVYPKSRGGDYSWENIVAACPECNQKKGSRTPEEAGMKLLKKPEKPRNYFDFELKKHGFDDIDMTQVWGEYAAS